MSRSSVVPLVGRPGKAHTKRPAAKPPQPLINLIKELKAAGTGKGEWEHTANNDGTHNITLNGSPVFMFRGQTIYDLGGHLAVKPPANPANGEAWTSQQLAAKLIEQV